MNPLARSIMNPIDKVLNAITMYKLVLYTLGAYAVAAIALCFTGLLSLSGSHMALGFAVLIVACFISNRSISYFWRVPTNTESWLITALILGCILPPPSTVSQYIAFALAAVVAMASKFLIALYNKHLLNPAAFAALALGLAGLLPATWWIGTPAMFPITVVFGLLILRKLRRFQLFMSFLLAAILVLLLIGLNQDQALASILKLALLSSPLVFLGTIMLTEPLTTPPKPMQQAIYGLIVGGLFASQFHFGNFSATPEFALIAGNLFSYGVSPKPKLLLRFKKKIQLTDTTYDFIFTPDRQLDYEAGQYMEWTLPIPDSKVDSRGNRRTFTIASSPTEDDIHLGVKLSAQSSAFKSALQALETDSIVVAGHLGGSFTLPKAANQKLVFIAGGIGITPFRSMVKYLIDTSTSHDIVLYYMISSPSEISYGPVFEQAKVLGVRTIPVLSNASGDIPSTWKGQTGRLTPELLQSEISDFKERTFYLSGPNAMVNSYIDMLKKAGVPTTSIKKDYFSGY